MFKKTEFDHIRSEIMLLHRQNLTQSVILNRLAHHKIGRKFVYRTIKRYCETGSEIPSKPAGRPRTKRTPGMIKKIRDNIRKNPCRSGRKMAKLYDMSHNTMQKLLKEDIGVKAYKKQVVAGLTEKNKYERVKRCKLILKRRRLKGLSVHPRKTF